MRIAHTLTALFIAPAAILLSTLASVAGEAASTTWLNVRSGPGTGFSVVDTLGPGEIVNVTECETNGWCYVEHPGPDGWVSSSFLTVPSEAEEASDPDCRLQLTIGPSGPTMSIVCGDGPVAEPSPAPTPVGDQACFYVNPNFGGERFCYGIGVLNSLNATFNDRISSVRLYGAAKARLCVNNNLGGFCRIVTNNVAALGPFINDRGSSLSVYAGVYPAPAPVAPVTYSTGAIDLPQTYTANLDNGVVGGPGADIWYRAVNPIAKFISPRNGAMLARGDGSNRGYAGCNAESFSASQIPLMAIPVGTYVCVRTNAGRISQFRVNGFAGTTMRIGYTTWAN